MILAACALPAEPSVSRQAASLDLPSLTITSDVVDPKTGEPSDLTLIVPATDNVDWDESNRPDSRVRGFHDATLSPTNPSVTRVFRMNAARSQVDFELLAYPDDDPASGVRLQVMFRTDGGWHVATDKGEEPIAFGGEELTATSPLGPMRFITTASPATITITNR